MSIMPVADAQGLLDRGLGHVRRGLEDAEAEGGQLDAVVEGDAGLCGLVGHFVGDLNRAVGRTGHRPPAAAREEGTGVRGTGSASLPSTSGRTVSRAMNTDQEIREFLTTRRARLTPEHAGLPTYGREHAASPGLRREEVALLGGDQRRVLHAPRAGQRARRVGGRARVDRAGRSSSTRRSTRTWSTWCGPPTRSGRPGRRAAADGARRASAASSMRWPTSRRSSAAAAWTSLREPALRGALLRALPSTPRAR